MNVSKLELQTVELEFYKSISFEFMKDISSLFCVTKDILNYSTSVTEKCLLGHKNIVTNIEIKPQVKCNFAWSILKQISCKVSCENEGDVIGSIQKITPSYSWAERAVLTLAAFACSYGELSCQIDNREANRFGQLAWLKQVDVLIEFQQNKQFRKAIADLNELTSLTLNIIMSILELEKLSNEVYIEDPSFVTNIKIHVENYSRLAISAAVACMAQVNYLTIHRVSIVDTISSLISIIKENLPKLLEFIKIFKSKIAEWAYWNLDISFRRLKGIVDVLTCFSYPQKPKLDCHAEKLVDVGEVLTGQSVLLFISEVKIPPYDYLALQGIHEELVKTKLNYKIVWMPMVQEWTPELIMEFNKVKQEMPWYILCYETTKPIVGIEYIKRQWQYCCRPMVVVLNSQGGIECPDAMQMIRIWGFQAFPFTLKPRPVDPCIRPIIIDLVEEKIEEETYIFLFGGTKDCWVKDFGKALIEMASDDYFKTTKIAIVPFSGEKVKRKEVIVPKMEIGQFWKCIDSLLCVRMQYSEEDDQVTKEIQNLLSFRSEEGWAALCQGSRVLVCASGNLVLQAVAEFNRWKNHLQTPGGRLEVCLRNYLKQLVEANIEPRQCRHVSLLPVKVEVLHRCKL